MLLSEKGPAQHEIAANQLPSIVNQSTVITVTVKALNHIRRRLDVRCTIGRENQLA